MALLNPYHMKTLKNKVFQIYYHLVVQLLTITIGEKYQEHHHFAEVATGIQS